MAEKKTGNAIQSIAPAQTGAKQLNEMSAAARLETLRNARGKAKYELMLEARDGAGLVPRLHPQEIYLTVSAVGPEYAAELLLLTSTEQITTLLDLDCWEDDRIDQNSALRWLALLHETGPEKVCRTLAEMEPELCALLLKSFIRIIAGPEAYDNDDADANANRLEGLYDIEYCNEEAAKIVGGILKMLQEGVPQQWMLLLEMVRSELDSVLEEEVYQARCNRLRDYGFVAPSEARGIYTRVDPADFQPADGKHFDLEADELQSPLGLLRLAQPGGLLAEVLGGGIGHELATELCLLVNRKMAADLVDPSREEDVTRAISQLYDGLNLGLEQLAGNYIERASALFRSCYLQQIFQLGHSLVANLVDRTDAILASPLGNLLDGPFRRFIEELQQNPPQLYRGIRVGDPQQPEAIRGRKQLQQIEALLVQLEAQKCLLDDLAPQNPAGLDLQQCNIDDPDDLTLSDLFLTALANQLLGGEFAPTPLAQSELATLHALVTQDGKLNPGIVEQVRGQLDQRCPGAGDFADYCLEIWQEEFCSLAPAELDPRYLSGLIVRTTD